MSPPVVRVNDFRMQIPFITKNEGVGARNPHKNWIESSSRAWIYSVCNVEASGLFFVKNFREETVRLGVIYVVGTRALLDRMIPLHLFDPESKVFSSFADISQLSRQKEQNDPRVDLLDRHYE